MMTGPLFQRSRGGFTLVEAVMVAAVISILARIALPNVQESITRAHAEAALVDIQVVRTAAAAYYARSNEWPAEAPAGVVPPEIEQDLPEGFTFERGTYQLDWERWALLDGLPSGAGPEVLLGIAIATEDEMLGNAVAALMGDRGWYSLGHTATFLIQ